MKKSAEPLLAQDCACSSLRKAMRAVSRHYEACLAPTGATTTQYSILRLLQREGSSALRDVADALELERTSLYRTIAPLERDGYVAVEPDPTDSRAKRAQLTDAGVTRIEEIYPHWRKAQDAFLAAVGNDDWSAMGAHLGHLRGRMAQDPGVQGQIERRGREAP